MKKIMDYLYLLVLVIYSNANYVWFQRLDSFISVRRLQHSFNSDERGQPLKRLLTKNCNESEFYVAAVVEYAPYHSVESTVADLVMKNAEQYVNYIAEAKAHDAEIIVFPEMGLVSYGKGTSYATPVPPADRNVNPCVYNVYNVTDELKFISCAARQYKMYVVVNIPEIQVCNSQHWDDDCTRNGTFYYNCNVAFDRNGTVVARYRKTHLFYEFGFSSPPTPDYSVFETDFGVTFGMFICFDILFQEPALKLVHEMNITDVIYPTAWISELPFLTGVQAQAQWSYAANVNFLGSGYSKPSSGSTGSGIYAGRDGPIVTIMVDDDTRELLLAKVSKKKRNLPRLTVEESENSILFVNATNTAAIKNVTKNTHKFHILAEDLSKYKTETLSTQARQQFKTVCHSNFCCEFEVEYDFNATSAFSFNNDVDVCAENFDYQYRFAVYQGVRKYGPTVTGNIQTCAVISCHNSSLSSCGILQNTIGCDYNNTELETVFSKIKISGSFRKTNGQLMPNTVLSNFQVVHPKSFDFVENIKGGSIAATLSTKGKIKNLLTFGIYGTMF